jgi:hypothetical protein
MNRRYKHPKIYHLPWSPGVTRDDRVLESTEHFAGRAVVVSMKMDGENTTLYPDGLHARSPEGSHGETSARIKAFHAEIARKIPMGWRICGENVQYRHSIHYRDLPHFFLVFSLWDESNTCLAWDETEIFCRKIGLKTVPVLKWEGWNEPSMRKFHEVHLDLSTNEGYVVRLANRFSFDDFDKSVAKFVRKGHVQTDKHWRHGPKVENHWVNA